MGILDKINTGFDYLVQFLSPILFFDISFGYFNIIENDVTKEVALPLIVIVLLTGALVFTLYFQHFAPSKKQE